MLPVSCVDRVNLGFAVAVQCLTWRRLLPSSEDGWALAVEALRPDGGVLHVHGNVVRGCAVSWLIEWRWRQPEAGQQSWAEQVRSGIEQLCRRSADPLKQRWQARRRRA